MFYINYLYTAASSLGVPKDTSIPVKTFANKQRRISSNHSFQILI